jgi:hypothetical protein
MTRLLVLLFVVLAVPAAHAQSGQYAPLVAQLPVGAQALGMGGWNASVRDVDAALGNPAYAGSMTSTSLSLARYADRVQSGAITNQSSIGVIGIAIGASYLDYGAAFPSLQARAFSGDALTDRGPFAAASLAGAIALSTTFKGFRLGMTGLYLEERVESTRASVAAGSIGASKDVFTGRVRLGLAIQNIGPDLRTPSREIELPTRVALGATGPVHAIGSYLDLFFSGGLAIQRDGFLSGGGGGELSYVPIEGISLAFRAGVRRPELRAQQPLTLGLGAAYDRLAVDYAWEQMDGGGAHRVSVRLR